MSVGIGSLKQYAFGQTGIKQVKVAIFYVEISSREIL